MDPADADNLIELTLVLDGRALPKDLDPLPESERTAALRGYFDRHHERQPLHFEGDALVAGAGDAEETTDTSEVADSDGQPGQQSEVDLLLGGYEGVSAEAQMAASVAPVIPVMKPSHTPVARSAKAREKAKSPGSSLRRGPLRPAPADKSEPLKLRAWMVWWVPSVLVPVVGGVVAWLFLRHKHVRAARAMLGIALAMAMIGSLLFLRYATEIAGYVSGDSRGTVIKLPAKPTGGNGGAPSSTAAPGSSGGASGKQ
jgi:hypothetical protein